MENIEEEEVSAGAEVASEGKDKMKVDILDLIAHLDSLTATTLREVVKDVVVQDKPEVQIPNDSSK